MGKAQGMAKRLNPHRRLLARQAALLREARLEQRAANEADTAILTQAPVRSVLNVRKHSILVYKGKRATPNWTSEDKPSKAGSVDRKGRLVTKPPKQLFSEQPHGPRYTPNGHLIVSSTIPPLGAAPLAHSTLGKLPVITAADTLRLRAAKAQVQGD